MAMSYGNQLGYSSVMVGLSTDCDDSCEDLWVRSVSMTFFLFCKDSFNLFISSSYSSLICSS